MMTDLDEFRIFCDWYNKLEAIQAIEEYESRTPAQVELDRKHWVNEGRIKPIYEKQECDDCG